MRLRQMLSPFYRRVSRNRMDEVETDLDLVFDETSTEPLPQSSEVVETLVTAVNDPNSGFDVEVQPNSIVVTSKKIF